MGILIFGTVWFWILLVVSAGLIIWFLESALDETEDYGGGLFSTLTIAAVFALYYFFGSREDVQAFFIYIKDNPGFALARVGIYIGIGLVWSIFKWYFFLQNKKEYLLKKFEENKSERWSPISERDIPKAANNKNRIITWMSYWPLSAFWTLINEPVKKLFKFIYSKIESLYEKMSDSTFSDLKNKIKEQEAKNK